MPSTQTRIAREIAARRRRSVVLCGMVSAILIAGYQILDSVAATDAMIAASAVALGLKMETRTVPNTVFYECVGIMGNSEIYSKLFKFQIANTTLSLK